MKKLQLFQKFYIFVNSMDVLSIIGIALALSFDSFAAAISCGLNCQPLKQNYKFLIPLSFSFFQAGMPLIGYFAGYKVLQFINSWDHWL
ncbi:MAG: manganese efflux pump, partial [Candidatus Delongbacteria bacterium]|nr:manganese efflux pump [Candidatus Delongbacteria bacterium]